MLNLGKGMVKFMLIREFSDQTGFGLFYFLNLSRFKLFSCQAEKLRQSWELRAEKFTIS
jgi:hypothetical protein